jgi:hypothetical protein
LESALHVSGALHARHLEFLKNVHAVIGTIVYRYGVRSGLPITACTVLRHS